MLTDPYRLLLCSPVRLTRTLGAAKVFVELANAMREVGWDVVVVGPEDYSTPSFSRRARNGRRTLSAGLKEYIIREGAEFDVVDFEHSYLPFDRSLFASRSLMVARSVLLAHHVSEASFPEPITVKKIVGKIVKGPARRYEVVRERKCAERTIENADLVNVSNDHDRRKLVSVGVDPAKIVVLPYGLADAAWESFGGTEIEGQTPTVAFVGTFDYRKGAKDFPAIVRGVVDQVPGVSFKLLGTKGMYKTEEEVRSQLFPRPAGSFRGHTYLFA